MDKTSKAMGMQLPHKERQKVERVLNFWHDLKVQIGHAIKGTPCKFAKLPNGHFDFPDKTNARRFGELTGYKMVLIAMKQLEDRAEGRPKLLNLSSLLKANLGRRVS